MPGLGEPRIEVLAKTCCHCKMQGPLALFSKNKECLGGRRGLCRVCENAIKKASRDNNSDLFRERERKAKALQHANMSADKRHRRSVLATAMQKKKPHKTKAQGQLKYAVKTGAIVRSSCERCGSANTHGHHEDYSKPLEVVWLCPLHHAERHRELKAMGVVL